MSVTTTASYVYIYIFIYIPGTPMTSMFEGQPTKTKPFSNHKGHLGSRYIQLWLAPFPVLVATRMTLHFLGAWIPTLTVVDSTTAKKGESPIDITYNTYMKG